MCIRDRKKENLRTVSQIRPDQDIIVTKWIGLEATTILAKEKEEELKKRFPAILIDTAKDFDPVSYTHLDVYKRQVLLSILRQGSDGYAANG